MTVVAKFYVYEKTEMAGHQFRVTLMPVCRGEENKQWSKWTPTGKIEMGILNESAVDQFVVGEEYFITFEHAPKKSEEKAA